MVQEIAPVVYECLKSFTDLINETFSPHTTGIPKILWQDVLGRLKIWMANIGAHRTGPSSLDFRLRGASHTREQVLRVLNGIKQDLEDLEDLDATISDQTAQLQSQQMLEQSTILNEAEEVFRAIQAAINRLFDISMIIRKPVDGDVLRGALQESVG